LKNAIILISFVALFSITSIVTIAYSQEDVDLLVKKGAESYNLGETQEALFYFDKALEIEPNHVKALTNKGGALSTLGKHEEAISYFDKALQIDPNYVDALSNKGGALGSLGEFDDAIKYIDQALEIEPNNIDALKNKAAVFIDQGNFNDAITYIHKVLALDPQNQTLDLILNFAYYRLGYTITDGFSEFLIRDDQGRLVTYFKSPYIAILNHDSAKDLVDSWFVSSVISFNGTDYNVHQRLYNREYQKETVFATTAVSHERNQDIRLLFAPNWGFPIDKGDTITILYTIYKPIE